MSVSDRIQDIQKFLQQTPLFQGIAAEQLLALANIAIPQTYGKGDTLFWQGDEGTGLFVVQSGRVKVFKLAPTGKEQILHIFSENEYFAEVPALDGGCFPASAAALEPTQVLFLPRSAFLMVLEQQPALAIALLSNFARHLRRLASLVDTLSFTEVPQRLAQYLLDLCDRTNGDSETGTPTDTIQLDLPKGQLAALLGTIPETLSRTFYKLSQAGLIEVEGTTVKLCDRKGLMQLANS